MNFKHVQGTQLEFAELHGNSGHMSERDWKEFDTMSLYVSRTYNPFGFNKVVYGVSAVTWEYASGDMVKSVQVRDNFSNLKAALDAGQKLLNILECYDGDVIPARVDSIFIDEFHDKLIESGIAPINPIT